MKRIIAAGILFSAFVVAILIASRTELVQPAVAQSKTREVPKFEVDPSWPRLPAKWVFGQVSSVSIDDRGHAWILQRPTTVRTDQKSMVAPPVLEFDADGNYVQGWGGPGEGYDWPEIFDIADGSAVEARGLVRRGRGDRAVADAHDAVALGEIVVVGVDVNRLREAPVRMSEDEHDCSVRNVGHLAVVDEVAAELGEAVVAFGRGRGGAEPDRVACG